MAKYATSPEGPDATRYHRVEIFSAHERDGIPVTRETLLQMGNRAQMRTETGHKYYLTKEHHTGDAVGYMDTFSVGVSDVWIGDDFVTDCPTLFADFIVPNTVAEEIEAGTWPRRSVYANIASGHLISCSLLGVHEDSWFGYEDLQGVEYSATVARTAEGAALAMYSAADGARKMPERKTVPLAANAANLSETKGPSINGSRQPTRERENADWDRRRRADLSGGKYEEDEKDPEDGAPVEGEGDVAATVPDGGGEEGEELSRLDRIEAQLAELVSIVKGGGAEEGAPEPPVSEDAPGEAPGLPADDAADMAIDEELDQYRSGAYSANRDEALRRVKASGKNLDPMQVQRSYRKIYQAHGPQAADRLVTALIEATPDAPGTGEGELDEHRNAAAEVAVLRGYSAEQTDTIRAAVAKVGQEEAALRLAEYEATCKVYGAEHGGKAYPVSMQDWLAHHPSQKSKKGRRG